MEIRITFLFFICLERVCRMSCPFPFLGNEVRVALEPAVPQVLLCALLEDGSAVDFFQASGTSSRCCHLSKTIQSFLFQKSSLSELAAGRWHGYLQVTSLLPESLTGQKPEHGLDIDCEVTSGSAGHLQGHCLC